MMESVAILVKNLASGGAEKQAVLLAKAFARDYDSHLIVMEGGVIDDRYRDMLADSDVTIHAVSAGRVGRFRAVLALFRQLRPRVVFSYLTMANIIGALAGRLASVSVVSGLRSTALPAWKMLADRLVTNHIASATIANSFSARDIFSSRGFNQSRITVIPNCFENIRPYRHKNVSDVVRVISVGRFVPDKDYLTAIKAVALARRRAPRLRYDIVGYGALEQQIRTWVKAEGIDDITRILINPDDIPALLDDADIYLCTSVIEGTSNALLEAMNADLPVVATDAGDNNRLVRDGVNGSLHSTRDVDGIAAALVALTLDADRRRDMGARSKELLLGGYSVDSFLNQYKSFITNLQ